MTRSIFGTTAWSPTTLNMGTTSLAALVMKLAGLRSPVGCAAHRGSAVEQGLVFGLQDFSRTAAECQDEALRTFDRLAALSPDPRKQREREAVPNIVATALAEFRAYGKPSSYQGRVEHRFPGLALPIAGYFDAKWDDHQILVDFKSTLKVPSQISAGHSRQVAIYTHNTNAEARVAYLGPHKLACYRLEEADRHVAELVEIAKRLERFFSMFDTIEECAAVVVPDLDSFYFSDPLAEANARELFGFGSAQAAASSLSTLEATAI